VYIALICAAVLTGCLGMGLPTSGTYILAAALIGGILVKHGIDIMQAHLFLLYFAALSALTPPVAIASYAAAALARTNPITTSMYAIKKATVAFIIPFGFVMHEGLLLRGDILGMIHYISAATLGAILAAAGIERYFLRPLKTWEWILVGLGGIALIVGNLELHLLGLILAVISLSRVSLQVWRERSRDAPHVISSVASAE
jgi:TRAP-type uncharacterized transport system fused permease subunit